MQQISEIFNLPKEKVAKSERAELLKFFVENLKDRKNKPMHPVRISMLLAHLNLQDLRSFISQCKDVDNRRGNIAMNKFFWWSLKPQ